MEKPENKTNQDQSLLTSIRDPYTLSNTNQVGDEVNRVLVEHFLQTLAEVAFNITSRNQRSESTGN
jgi:hypothetical protein